MEDLSPKYPEMAINQNCVAWNHGWNPLEDATMTIEERW
jgi:hypothetical protein